LRLLRKKKNTKLNSISDLPAGLCGVCKVGSQVSAFITYVVPIRTIHHRDKTAKPGLTSVLGDSGLVGGNTQLTFADDPPSVAQPRAAAPDHQWLLRRVDLELCCNNME